MPPAPEPIIATRLRGAGGEAVVGIVAVCCFVMAMVRKVRNMTDVLKVDIWRVLVQGAKVKVMTRRWWFRVIGFRYARDGKSQRQILMHSRPLKRVSER